MSGGIFISYRRDDNRYAAGRFYDRLADHFGREKIFMDVDAIEPGLDFVEVLSQRVATCNVLVAVIGPQWLDIRDANGLRRLDDPNDFVRIELEAALSRGIRVVPVLVDGATIPREADLPPTLAPLARRNAVTLTHATFGRDVAALMTVLGKDVRPKRVGWLGKTSSSFDQTRSGRPVSGSPGAGPAWTLASASLDWRRWISWIALDRPFGWSHIAVGALVGSIGSFLPFTGSSLLGFSLPFTTLKPDFGLFLGLSLAAWLFFRRSVRSAGEFLLVLGAVIVIWFAAIMIMLSFWLLVPPVIHLGMMFSPVPIILTILSSLALSLIFADYYGWKSWIGRNSLWVITLAVVGEFNGRWLFGFIPSMTPKELHGPWKLYSGPWLGSAVEVWSAWFIVAIVAPYMALFFWLIGRQADRQRPPNR